MTRGFLSYLVADHLFYKNTTVQDIFHNTKKKKYTTIPEKMVRENNHMCAKERDW